MSVNNENSKNNQYVFRYADGNLSKVITYKKYLIEEIKDHPNAKNNFDIQSFSSESVTDNKFERFITIAKNAGFTVYEIKEL